MSLLPHRRKRQIEEGTKVAEQALQQSVDALQEAVVDGQASRSVSDRLRGIQHRNHFQQIVTHAYRGTA